ncbi:hypothetical protein AT270_08820 [Bacillus cereus]|nr:hypothetical protein AT270_08820 [Bacillus cereus]
MNQSILQILFAYVDSLTIGGVTPITGRPPICRKALLKYFFLKTVFQIKFLRKLTRFLHQYPSFLTSCGLSFDPYISTFLRVGTWFREEDIPAIHEKVLQALNLGMIPCALIDSTLRNSLYEIHKQSGGNRLVMVGIKDIKLMSVLHQKVFYCLMHLQLRMYMIAK